MEIEVCRVDILMADIALTAVSKVPKKHVVLVVLSMLRAIPRQPFLNPTSSHSGTYYYTVLNVEDIVVLNEAATVAKHDTVWLVHRFPKAG
jgi:hypothetical protein